MKDAINIAIDTKDISTEIMEVIMNTDEISNKDKLINDIQLYQNKNLVSIISFEEHNKILDAFNNSVKETILSLDVLVVDPAELYYILGDIINCSLGKYVENARQGKIKFPCIVPIIHEKVLEI